MAPPDELSPSEIIRTEKELIQLYKRGIFKTIKNFPQIL
jgi:hypothetical protein